MLLLCEGAITYLALILKSKFSELEIHFFLKIIKSNELKK